MRLLIRIVLAMSIAGAFAGWVLCAIPGRFEFYLMASIFLTFLGFGAFVVFGVPLGILYIVLEYYAIRDRFLNLKISAVRAKFDKSMVAEALAIPVVWFVFLIVCIAKVPETIGFRFCRSQFEAAAAEFSASQASMRKDGRFVIALGKKFGIYYVDEVGIDGRGGIYFRVNTGQDGIGPDRVSYGFVKRPNSTGSPFGRKRYSVIQIAGEWYTFEASDDFF